jgi:hypothetical protein
MKVLTEKLISELEQSTRQNIDFAEKILLKTDKEINYRASQDSWSVLECLQHLNLYGRFYVPEISQKIAQSQTKAKEIFVPGLLGNYFVNMMIPKENLNRMKTFKSMNPIHSTLNKGVLHEFIAQQNQLMSLLNESKNVDLNKVKTGISISRLIKLKLGDTLRFVIYHNLRHIEQAKKILNV